MNNRKGHHGRWLRRTVAGASAAAIIGLAASAAQGSSTAQTTTHYGTLPDGAEWVADVPSHWNGRLILFSHGYLETEPPTDSPSPQAKTDLLADGYALAGSTYQPNQLWGLDSAVRDQFEAEKAVETSVLPRRPKLVIALGQSMGGLVSALEDQDADGRINGALTTCGIVAGGLNLENYQLDGSYAISALLAPLEHIQLDDYQTESQAAAAGAELQQAAQQAQKTAQGRARLALASALYNVTTWTATDVVGENFNPSVTPPPNPPPAKAYNEQEDEQYDTQYTHGSVVEPFVETGRWSIEQAVGGQPSWDAGVNFSKVLASSPYLPEVKALYREAHLSLGPDLRKLTAGANIKAQPAALKKLIATSVPTGRLQVPELDIHTIADELVPVQQENFYRATVDARGDGQLLRQAFVKAEGHCNFTAPEYLAGLQALIHRIKAGQKYAAKHRSKIKNLRKNLWGSVATAKALQAAALKLHEGSAAFIRYRPGTLTGADRAKDAKVGSRSGGLAGP